MTSVSHTPFPGEALLSTSLEATDREKIVVLFLPVQAVVSCKKKRAFQMATRAIE